MQVGNGWVKDYSDLYNTTADSSIILFRYGLKGLKKKWINTRSFFAAMTEKKEIMTIQRYR